MLVVELLSIKMMLTAKNCYVNELGIIVWSLRRPNRFISTVLINSDAVNSVEFLSMFSGMTVLVFLFLARNYLVLILLVTFSKHYICPKNIGHVICILK